MQAIGQAMSPRGRAVDQPLVFSLDERLDQQHLTRLDLTSRSLRAIDPLPANVHFNVVLLDKNQIAKVEHLDHLTQLIQLSISHNRLIDIRSLQYVRSLQKLNLSHNMLGSIECLGTLQNLVMLNIANNNIRTIAALDNCRALQSLDASSNSIQQLEDLSHAVSLKYLNLHQNFIHTLTLASRHWPRSLHTLVISNNEIQDLTEISCLSSLIALNTLYIANNPCLSVIDERRGCHQPFDYRPFVHNWCLTVNNLDGIFLTRKESLKAEWLRSQGKGRSFRLGEHAELVQYLVKVCGTDLHERDDLHLSRIMFHQDLYRQQTPTRSDGTEMIESNHLSRDERSFHEEPMTTRSNTISSTSVDEHSPRTRYNHYDNRPVKPLDQSLLQTELSQYPISSHADSPHNDQSRIRASTHPQRKKRASVQLAYNAKRYTPKATSRGPSTSTAFHSRSTKALTTRYENQLRRQTTTSMMPEPCRDDDTVPSASAPPGTVFTMQSTAMNESVELQRVNTSMETMRTSFLQGYLDLNERFARATELQTSALTALWRKCEAEHLAHQRDTNHLREENRLLQQRIQELENRLHGSEPTAGHSISDSSALKHNPNLYPPLRAHISKRDTRSFFLHWIPSPLNETRPILGYRIYVDDRFKGAIEPGQFEAIIDYIRDEGEYKIKLRTFDQRGESSDSNIVVARFRRQCSATQRTTTDQQPVDFLIEASSEGEVRTPRPLDEQAVQKNGVSAESSPIHVSPKPTISHADVLRGKPPKSPSSSPSRAEAAASSVDSPSKNLVYATAKRSPIKTGVMSRLARSPYRVTLDNSPHIDRLPVKNLTSPTDGVQPSKNQVDPPGLVESTSNPPLPGMARPTHTPTDQ